ncbi:MAG: hypothetical protein H6707_09840 [Deltaproteobacteria bacterium]|nr:hypothetical protein [Deltaproteobacteria bacterium]
MKKLLVVFALIAMAFGGVALAATQYHVYKKNGSNKCEIDMRDHAQWKSGRGSGWTCLGHDTSRIDAEKIFKQAGCQK